MALAPDDAANVADLYAENAVLLPRGPVVESHVDVLGPGTAVDAGTCS